MASISLKIKLRDTSEPLKRILKVDRGFKDKACEDHTDSQWMVSDAKKSRKNFISCTFIKFKNKIIKID